MVHKDLKALLQQYSDIVTPKSIDEFNLDFSHSLEHRDRTLKTAKEIKLRIQKEIGEWIRVSIGFGPNRFLAKVAAGLGKVDGLEVIDCTNYKKVYQGLDLTDLPGIAHPSAFRLANYNIKSVLDFYTASEWTLRAAFQSIAGYYWFLRIHGNEIDSREPQRKSFGNSYALPDNRLSAQALKPILTKFVYKMTQRMRKQGFFAKTISISITYRDFSHWHSHSTSMAPIFESNQMLQEAYRLLQSAPFAAPVKIIAVVCSDLVNPQIIQRKLFEDVEKPLKLTLALDEINNRWGDYTLGPATMIGAKQHVPDRISFGKVREIE